MINSIRKHCQPNVIFWAFISYLMIMFVVWLSWNAHIAIDNFRYDNTPSETIWQYEYIKAVEPVTVWNPIVFETSRWSKETFDITMLETLRCNNEKEFVTSSYVPTFAYKAGKRTGNRYTFADREGWIPRKTYKDCRMESCQRADYHWIDKEQCFYSNFFNIE